MTDPTANQLRHFFSAVWAGSDIVEVRAIRSGGGRGAAPRSRWHTAGEWASGRSASWLRDANRQGWNLYAGVLPRAAPGQRGNAGVLPGAAAWADIDHVDPAEAERRLAGSGLPPPSVIINSGHGVQCYWLLAEKRNPADLRALVGDIAVVLESDPSVKNEERVLRLPGFVNHKPPAADALLLVCDAERLHDFADLRALVPSAAPGRAAPPAAAPHREDDDGVLERARRYLATVPGSGPGGRTNKLYRLAAVLVRDYALDHAAARDLLARWDAAANAPPVQSDPHYGPGELDRILANAGRYGRHGVGGFLPPPADGFDTGAFARAVSAADGPEADGAAAVADEKNGTSRAPDPGPFPKELLAVPGFMGELAGYIDERNHKSQPVLALAAALVAMGTLTGRKVEGVTGLRTNFYVLGVAETGEGKNAPREVLKQILYDPDNLFYYAVDRLRSDAGIRSALEVNPCVVFVLDEIGEFLETIRYSRNAFWIRNIIPELMTLYSSAASPHVLLGGFADAKKMLDVNCPHLGLFGTSVPRSVFAAMTMNSVTNGFIGRLLIFEGADRNPPKKRPTLAPIPWNILDAARWWREFLPGGTLSGNHPGTVSRPLLVDESRAASARFGVCEREAREAVERCGREWSGPFNRVEENARKLALAYACSERREKPFIGTAAAEWGSALSLYLTKRLVYLAGMNVADNETHDQRNRVLRAIVEAGEGGITRQALIRKCQFLKSRDLSEVVGSLVAAEEVAAERRQSGRSGRPAEIYTAITSIPSQFLQDAGVDAIDAEGPC